MENQRGNQTTTDDADNAPRTELQLPEPHDGLATKENSNVTHKPAEYFKSIGMDPSKFWPKKYRFSREKPTGRYNPLTVSQRNFYETNGYIVFDDCTGRRLLESLRQSLETSSIVDQSLIDALLVDNNKLIQYAKCFCDERLMLMTHRLVSNFQTVSMQDVIDNGQQQSQVLSRDWMYLPFRPIDKVCCAVTAIEPLERVILVVPGTHRVGQCTISSTPDTDNTAFYEAYNGNLQTRQIFESSPEHLSTLINKSDKGFKYVNLNPGQTLFYHPGLIHGFNNDLINFRKKQRALIAYYAAADCEFVDVNTDLTAKNGVESSKRQPVPVGLAHFEPNESPMDYRSWLNKPRLINTRNANF